MNNDINQAIDIIKEEINSEEKQTENYFGKVKKVVTLDSIEVNKANRLKHKNKITDNLCIRTNIILFFASLLLFLYNLITLVDIKEVERLFDERENECLFLGTIGLIFVVGMFIVCTICYAVGCLMAFNKLKGSVENSKKHIKAYIIMIILDVLLFVGFSVVSLMHGNDFALFSYIMTFPLGLLIGFVIVFVTFYHANTLDKVKGEL